MFYSNELIEKAKAASSAEELLELAKANGIELSAKDAEMYFTFLTTDNGSLSDEELEQVAGGKGGPQIPTPKYHKGQRLCYHFPDKEKQFEVLSADHYSVENGWFYTIKFLEDDSTRMVYLEINENIHP